MGIYNSSEHDWVKPGVWAIPADINPEGVEPLQGS